MAESRAALSNVIFKVRKNAKEHDKSIKSDNDRMQPMKHFWKSTRLCFLDLDLLQDTRLLNASTSLVDNLLSRIILTSIIRMRLQLHLVRNLVKPWCMLQQEVLSALVKSRYFRWMCLKSNAKPIQKLFVAVVSWPSSKMKAWDYTGKMTMWMWKE